MVKIGDKMGTTIDISSSRLQQLIDDKMNPLRAVQNFVTVFFTHSERVNIRHIRMANEIHRITTIKNNRLGRPKGSKRKK